VRKHLQGPDEPAAVKERPANIVDLENKLRETLGTGVTINARKGGKRGKIIIEFYSLDEFDRLTKTMGLTTEQAI
jgi:ParB family chromosome partitioning protein